MAPPINPFKLMGKPADASPSGKAKGKGKGRTKGSEAEKKLKKPMADAPMSKVSIQPSTEQESSLPPPMVQDLSEPDREEELQPRKKIGRTEPSSILAKGPSSHSEAWDPTLLFGPNPISIQDTILDNSNNEASAQVAHGLAFAACLPEDMEQWAETQPGAVFRDITRGLMMVTYFLTYLHTLFRVAYLSFLQNILYLLLFSLPILFLLRLLKASFLWKQGFSG